MQLINWWCAFKTSGMSGDRGDSVSSASQTEQPECVSSREAETLSYYGTRGKRGHSRITDWGTGSHGVRLIVLCSACLPCVAASKCLHESAWSAALWSHNSGIKATRIKCCVTLRKRNSVTMRRACAGVCVCMRTYKCIGVWSALFLCICWFEVAA